MSSSLRLFLFSCFLFSLFASSAAQTCKSQTFANGKTFRSCTDLLFLDSFIHFSYVPETGVLDLAYRHTNIRPSSWVAWAINPIGKGMIGSQALVAYRNSTSGAVRAYTSPITSYRTMLQEGPLSFSVKEISAEYADNQMTIFARLVLPKNTTVVNHLWQDGPVDGGRPGMHSLSGDHLRSIGTLDLLSGQVTASTGGPKGNILLVKKIHGVLNTLSWGILMPIGALAARYMRIYEGADPLWFYTHIICQTTGYIIGLSGGLGTAIYMWRSTGFRVTPHSVVGIVLFFLGFLQILALKARPDKKHKFRGYWNWYHRITGYAVIVLSIINIYKGFGILQPGSAWKIGYTSFIVLLGAFAFVMEILHWNKRWGGAMEILKRRWGGVCCDEPRVEDSNPPVIDV